MENKLYYLYLGVIYDQFIKLKKNIERNETTKNLHMEIWNPIYEKLITDNILVDKYFSKLNDIMPRSCIYCYRYETYSTKGHSTCKECPFVELNQCCNDDESWYDIYSDICDEYEETKIENESDLRLVVDAVWGILTVPETY